MGLGGVTLSLFAQSSQPQISVGVFIIRWLETFVSRLH